MSQQSDPTSTSEQITEVQASNNVAGEEVSDERLEFEESFEADGSEQLDSRAAETRSHVSGAPVTGLMPTDEEFQWPDLLVAALALAAWFVLFIGGYLIGTEPFRMKISGSAPLEFSEHAKAWYVVITFWTITNVGILACTASLLGAVGRRIGFTANESSDETEAGAIAAQESAERRLTLYYSCAVMRGFGVYSLFLAGYFVFAPDSANSPEQMDYINIAPLLSIVGFYAGYDPVLFSGLLSRAKKVLDALPI